MANLFSPLTIAGIRLQNRIVMAPTTSGYTRHDGFISDELYHYYLERVHGGVALIITEPARIVPPSSRQSENHLGLYHDVFIPRLHHLTRAVHGGNVRIMPLLDAPAEMAHVSLAELVELREQFIQAAWRARAAGCDGVMLSSANGGILHTLLSPSLNPRNDDYGGMPSVRLRLCLEIIEGIREWIGHRLLIGFRLIADEFSPAGISLQDARFIAGRLAATGVNLLDVTADEHTSTPLARFPGWHIPLANGIKRVIPETPVIGSGLLDDPQLADSVIEDNSVDLVMLDQTLQTNPYWPKIARIILLANAGDTEPL
jgi:2,4-dienoyl-CoA reductase-like NADH-dependent reductase (Old Yellow Enzyme family)